MEVEATQLKEAEKCTMVDGLGTPDTSKDSTSNNPPQVPRPSDAEAMSCEHHDSPPLVAMLHHAVQDGRVCVPICDHAPLCPYVTTPLIATRCSSEGGSELRD